MSKEMEDYIKGLLKRVDETKKLFKENIRRVLTDES